MTDLNMSDLNLTELTLNTTKPYVWEFDNKCFIGAYTSGYFTIVWGCGLFVMMLVIAAWSFKQQQQQILTGTVVNTTSDHEQSYALQVVQPPLEPSQQSQQKPQAKQKQTQTQTQTKKSGNVSVDLSATNSSTLTIFLSKIFWQDIYHKKKCFGALMTHIIDQASDIELIYGFYRLWQYSEDSNCVGNNINEYFLFIACLCSFLFYRFVSSFVILFGFTRHVTRISNFSLCCKRLRHSFIYFVLQLFDLMLFRTIWVNYKNNTSEPCNPQRWIQGMEAMTEAFPQMVFGLYYLLQTNTNNSDYDISNSYFLIISLFFSISTMVNKSVSEDKFLFTKNFQSLHCSFRMRCKKKTFDEFNKEYKTYVWCFNPLYLLRYLCRLLDITTRLATFVIFFTESSYTAIVVYICIELLLVLIAVIFTQKLGNILKSV